MNILLISECNKKALTETRRVLDQFAERKGRRTWQTPITNEGLKTLRMLLKKTARRNTAVACYWIRGKNNTELLWTVGNRRRFNDFGTVPTNVTERDILRSEDENAMHSNHAQALMAGIAGLFHDFGKANALFQKQLRGKENKHYQPYRHEWISTCLFISFVNQRPDKEWLEHLSQLTEQDDKKLRQQFEFRRILSLQELHNHSPLAAAICWLILSHHRLPQDLNSNDHDLNDAERWFTEGFDLGWNALNHKRTFTEKEKQDVVNFPDGTPFKSIRWRYKAQKLAKQALRQHNLIEMSELKRAFPLHVARMALMLADHSYSAGEPCKRWQDPDYPALANTDRKTKQPKQKLDEHCVGVAHNAWLLTRVLPNLRGALPAIARHAGLRERTTIPHFRWQNRAYELAASIREQTFTQGFFGVNMASTGRGKTFANAKIMYGLADPQTGCRFSVALGLRTLTLQTGEALQKKLKLEEDELAVHIGSQAVKQLFDKEKAEQEHQEAQKREAGGSESETMFAEHNHVHYEGELDNTYFNRWIKNSENIHKLISAPISVSTIDHIIPVSEGVRGGKQIAPLLRLLTSDLILDEPDDFGIDDIPALNRLVYWAGLLGSRVLLSSATLPPSLITGLFEAYQYGRRQFNLVHHEQKEQPVMCAWFDEFSHNQTAKSINSKTQFEKEHCSFTTEREKQLQQQPALHFGDWLPLITETTHPDDSVTADGSIAADGSVAADEVIPAFAKTVLHHAQVLAKQHHTTTPNGEKTFSAGIVRMANIDPLVAVAKELLTLEPQPDTRIHYCIYHSQHPLGVRSEIENDLDELLKRDINKPITELPKVQQAFKQHPEQHHIFIVLATPVAEVGRDHDYDWAIIEPSSMRSIIQMAGRVQRHRKQAPSSANILIFEQNIKALKGEPVAYQRPGFESNIAFKLNSTQKKHKWLMLPEHNLRQLKLQGDNYNHLSPITSKPRFTAPAKEKWFDKNNKCVGGFIELEHLALYFQIRDKAQVWWHQPHAHLFGQIQKQTRFRQSRPKESYFFFVDDIHDESKLWQWDPFGKEPTAALKLDYVEHLTTACRVSMWTKTDLETVMTRLSKDFDLDMEQTCIRYATIELEEPSGKNAGIRYQYHPILGVFRG